MLCYIMFVSHFFTGENFVVVVLDRLFFIWETKRVVAGHIGQVVVLTVTTVWEFAWADLTLVVLDKWSSYRGGRFNRFDCKYLVVS